MITHERPRTNQDLNGVAPARTSSPTPGGSSALFASERPSTQAPVYEELLHLLDKAVVLAAQAGDGRVEVRFLNRAAERLLAAPRAHVASMIEGSLRRTLEGPGANATPAVDHWVCGGRALRARVTRLKIAGGESVAVELEAEHVQPREGTAALAQAFQLNMQEARLLRLVWRGLANEEIGASLGIPAGTVKSRLYRLFRRLGVRTRAQAAVLAADLLARMNMTAEAANESAPVAGTT
jgi:DNA-binding CsgD family transcriptional regulator